MFFCVVEVEQQVLVSSYFFFVLGYVVEYISY